MKSFCLLVAFLVLSPSKAFDSDKFLKKFCKISSECLHFVRNVEVLCCEDVTFTKEELEEIQTEDFEISQQDNVFFGRGVIGIVNSNFFSKFPNASEMSFANSNLSLKNKEEAFTNSQLKKLNFYEAEISDNINSIAFHSLTDLESLVFMGNRFEFKELDSILLKRNRNLKNLMVVFNRDRQTIHKDAFKNLFSLETLVMYNVGQMIPSGLIKNNTNIKNLTIASSSLTKVPDNIPESVEVLNLSVNRIKVISKKDFQNLGHLKELRINYSALEEIEEDTFDELIELETLSLSLNKLTAITPRHFENCVRLKWINLASNELLNDTIVENLKKNVKFEIVLNRI